MDRIVTLALILIIGSLVLTPIFGVITAGIYYLITKDEKKD